MEAYCLKCRARREIRNPTRVTMKNGKPAAVGQCPVCGTRVYRIGKVGGEPVPPASQGGTTTGGMGASQTIADGKPAQERPEAEVPEDERPTPHGPEPPVEVAGRVATHAHQDTPATLAEDRLGFSAYARAMGLMARYTEPPLTVGILGPWGTGKSSMLTMIRQLLEERRGFHGKEEPAIVTVWFNAWEHRDAAKIWSVLVREILGHLEARAGMLGRLRFILRRRWAGWWLMFKSQAVPVTTALLGLAGAIALSFVFRDSSPSTGELATVAGTGGAGGLLLLRDLWNAAQSPASRQAYRFLAEIDIARHPGYITQVERDIDFLSEFIVRHPPEGRGVPGKASERGQSHGFRVVVFIDDLDRCPPDKAVDVLEVVKLILERQIFVTFLALDARVLARAVEERYRGVLLESTHPGGPGMEYLDKIIQLPFWIGYRDMTAYLDALTRLDTSPAGMALPDGPTDSELRESHLTETESTETEPQRVILSETDRTLLTKYSRFLSDNPRGVKRVVNLYRFAKSLAVLDGEAECVLRCIVLSDRWPDFAQFVNRRFVAGADPRSEEDWRVLAREFQHVVTESHAWSEASERYRLCREAEFDLLEQFLSTGHIMSPEAFRNARPYAVNFCPIRQLDALQRLAPLPSGFQHPV